MKNIEVNIFDRHKVHQKISDCIIGMLTRQDYLFYAEIALRTNFIETKSIQTAGVNVTSKGMNFYYNSEFIDSLNTTEINFLVVHEISHLLWDHPSRTTKFHIKKLANEAQDMIINQNIIRYFTGWANPIKDEHGNNAILFIPNDYTGYESFEILYDWLYDKYQEYKNKQKSNNSGPTSPNYGNFGKNNQDMYDLDTIFKNGEENDGQFFDQHLEDEISDEMKKELVKDMIQGLKNRGLVHGNTEILLGNLRRQKKDYLKEIKKAIGTIKNNSLKDKSYHKPNRKILGLKGKFKIPGFEINCLLDTSGSMNGYFEKVLSYIFRSDITINLIQCDTQINKIDKIKTLNDFKNLKITGLGGTVLQPGIDYIVKDTKLNKFNTVVLSDTMHESLNFDKLKGKVLYISAYKGEPPICGKKKVRKIIITENF